MIIRAKDMNELCVTKLSVTVSIIASEQEIDLVAWSIDPQFLESCIKIFGVDFPYVH
jgi:hypothetical protein